MFRFFTNLPCRKKCKNAEKEFIVFSFETRCIENQVFLEAYIIFHDLSLELSVLIKAGDVVP